MNFDARGAHGDFRPMWAFRVSARWKDTAAAGHRCAFRRVRRGTWLLDI